MEFYTDSVESVRRLADRINIKCVQQLGFSWPSNRARKESNWTRDWPPRFTTLATSHCQSQKMPPRLYWKWAQCSEPHNDWRYKKFRSASLNDRLKNVRQRGFVNCVLTNDLLQNCAIGYSCRLSGCGKDHRYLLHPVTEKADENDCRVNSHSAPEGSTNSSCCNVKTQLTVGK